MLRDASGLSDCIQLCGASMRLLALIVCELSVSLHLWALSHAMIPFRAIMPQSDAFQFFMGQCAHHIS